jgi:hypothetical protein
MAGRMVAFKYFVAAPADVPAAFPGWRFPIAVPERRQLRNPFTGEPIFNADGTPLMITTTRPRGPWIERPRCPELAPFSPTDLWPISSMHIAALTEALGVMPPQPEDALFAPESWGWSLRTVSDASVRAIAHVDAPLKAVASWQSILCRINVDLLEDLNDVDWRSVLDELVRLSRAAVPGRSIYVYEGADPEYALEMPTNWTVEHATLE